MKYNLSGSQINHYLLIQNTCCHLELKKVSTRKHSRILKRRAQTFTLTNFKSLQVLSSPTKPSKKKNLTQKEINGRGNSWSPRVGKSGSRLTCKESAKCLRSGDGGVEGVDVRQLPRVDQRLELGVSRTSGSLGCISIQLVLRPCYCQLYRQSKTQSLRGQEYPHPAV